MAPTTSFQERLMKLQANMLNFAFMLTSNRDDAYDLLQDTTLKVLDNHEKYTENVNFKGWVFTVMRNIFINNYRTSGRRAVIVDRTEDVYRIDLAPDTAAATPEGTVAEREISDAINALEEELREPFRLHVVGYKYHEIAEMTGYPLGTVKSRIFYARKRLQARFAQYC